MSQAAVGQGPRPVGLPPVALHRLLEVIPGLRPTNSYDVSQGDTLISGVSLRSSDIRPGDVFLALPGSTAHGATFALAAVAAGARAVVTDPAGVELLAQMSLPVQIVVIEHAQPRLIAGLLAAEIYHHPSRQLPIIGITGTAGKTTTCYLLAAGLHAAGIRTGVIGTIETRIGQAVLPSALTTPEAPDLQGLFAVMLQQQVQAVVMEVSSHALALGRVAGTSFAVGAFTNLSQDHLDFHHTMDEYFAAKALLFDGRARREVIVIDDEYGQRLAARRPAAITVATRTDLADVANWAATATPAGAGQQTIHLTGPGNQHLTVTIALPGAFNVANAATALVALDTAGFDTATAATGLAQATVPGRMEQIDCGQPFLAMVDYAHKPEALRAVLTATRAAITGQLIVVLGAGGDRDHSKRPLMGQIAAELADRVIITDDNPRSEDPASIRAAIMDGALAAQTAAHICDEGGRRAAIAAAVSAAKPGDAVVVAGKGHETGQESHGEIAPFSDREELRAALEARGWSA